MVWCVLAGFEAWGMGLAEVCMSLAGGLIELGRLGRGVNELGRRLHELGRWID